MATMNVKGLDLVDNGIEPAFDTELGYVYDHNIVRTMSEVAKSLKKALNKNPNLQITLTVL